MVEQGKILFLSRPSFCLSEKDTRFLIATGTSASRYQDRFEYSPALQSIRKLNTRSGIDSSRLTSVLRSWSDSVASAVSELLPQYSERWRIDSTVFHIRDEAMDKLPVRKREDLLHVDTLRSRPVHGHLILRAVLNIHPYKAQVWAVGDPFRQLAWDYALGAGLANYAIPTIGGSLLSWLSLHRTSAYDRFMANFQDFLKRNSQFQQRLHPVVELPPLSGWLLFTDVVPHAVLTSQYTLEQTFVVSRESLADPANAPISILENLCRRRLAAAG